MSELEIRQAAFHRLRPKYKWAVRGLAFCLAVGPLLALCVVNLGLALVLGVKAGVPVKEQAIGQLWFVLFISQIAVVVPLAAFRGRRALARFVGKRKGWPEQQINDISAGRSYPSGWSN